jgi:hypothetical protein
MQLVPRVGDAETTGDLVAVEDVAGRVTVHADTEGPMQLFIHAFIHESGVQRIDKSRDSHVSDTNRLPLVVRLHYDRREDRTVCVCPRVVVVALGAGLLAGLLEPETRPMCLLQHVCKEWSQAGSRVQRRRTFRES